MTITKTTEKTFIRTTETDEVSIRMHQRKAQLDALKAEQDKDAETLRQAAKVASGIQGGGKTFAFGPEDLVTEITHRAGGSYLPAKDFVVSIFVIGRALLDCFVPKGRISVSQEQVEQFAAVEFRSKRKQAAQKKVVAAIKRAAESWAVKVVA